MVGRIYKGNYYKLLNTKCKSSGRYGVSEKKIFFYVFFHCKYMGANDLQGGTIFDPRGMSGKIYVGFH